MKEAADWRELGGMAGPRCRQLFRRRVGCRPNRGFGLCDLRADRADEHMRDGRRVYQG